MAVRNIQIDSKNPAAGVTVTCSPPDSLSSSTQPSPSSFSCTSTVSYTFTVPATVGYNTFDHWVDAKPTPNVTLPEGTTGNVTVTGNTLVLAPPLINNGFIAVYTAINPVAVNITSAVPSSGVVVTTDIADLNGKISITTPDSFSYLDNGTKPTFVVDPHYRIKIPSVLNNQLFDEYDIDGWYEAQVKLDSTKNYKITITGARDIVVNYIKTPAPWYPTNAEVEMMNSQLKLAVDPASILDQYLLLWDDAPIKVFNRWLFRDSTSALADARKLLLTTYPNWVTRLPSADATWARDPANKELFFNYVLTTRFSTMLFADFKKQKLIRMQTA